jgi:hypothetical protein
MLRLRDILIQQFGFQVAGLAFDSDSSFKILLFEFEEGLGLKICLKSPNVNTPKCSVVVSDPTTRPPFTATTIVQPSEVFDASHRLRSLPSSNLNTTLEH